MSSLSGKTALVTGASRGIGRAIATRLARDGARVAVNYARSVKAAESLAAEIGGLAVQADIADPAEIRTLFDTVFQSFGRLDILVNNAGIALMKPIAEVTEEEYDRVFALNARGAFFCLQQAALRMNDGGRIVNISTGATVGGTAGGAIYCGAKAALEQFTRALAREVAPRGITVNTLSPGFTDTDMLNANPHLVELGAKLSPMKRIGAPEDVADAVAFLCSHDARWITGQNIQAGGGVSMT